MNCPSYYIKSIFWLILDCISTCFVLWIVLLYSEVTNLTNTIFLLISILIRIVVWASVYLPFEYYYSWTPTIICMNDNEF